MADSWNRNDHFCSVCGGESFVSYFEPGTDNLVDRRCKAHPRVTTAKFEPTPEGAIDRLNLWLDSTLGDVQIYPADVRTLIEASGLDDSALTLNDNTRDWLIERAFEAVAAEEPLSSVTRADIRQWLELFERLGMARISRQAISDQRLVDLWWTTCDGEWAVPDDVMVRFGRAAIRAGGE